LVCALALACALAAPFFVLAAPFFVLAAPGIKLAAPGIVPAPPLRVCADPALMPTSNDRGLGFENRIARIVAGDLRRDLAFVWAAERQGFIRRYLLAGACDVVMAVPVGLAPLGMSRPYFASGFVMVSRRAAGLRFTGFDAPWLARARIGVPALGDGGVNIPPAMALAQRGLGGRITGFAVLGGDDPQRRMVAAVADGALDVAFMWGPQAGYFARRYGQTLRVELLPADSVPGSQLIYGFAAAVRPGDAALRDAIDQALARHRADITAVLTDLGVPLAALPHSRGRRPD